MVISVSSAATAVLGRKPNFPVTITANLGWVLWAGSTFVVIYLARRFTFERTRLAQEIAIHIVLGIVVALTQLACEFGIRHAIEVWLFSPPRPRTLFVSTLAYKFHVYF